ncbi:hypothetical protein ACFRCQ_07570 [Cytobacillus firmus]|uniref:hypothetical protein n=1 Tax=Cytobacillus firmus TaxID=1399 RepID=UPI00367D27F9
MKEIEAIKNKIVELETKKKELAAEIAEISKAIEDSFEDLLLGKVDEKTIDQAKELFEEKTEELRKTEEYIQRAKIARRKFAFEKVIPFAKDKREKQVQEAQKKYNDQVKNVHKARAAFLEELAKLGKVRGDVGKANSEFNQMLVDMGESPQQYGATLTEKPIVSGGWTNEKECLGVAENVQKSVYSSGNIPQGFRGES